MRRFLFILLALAAALASAQPARAHPIDQHQQFHTIRFLPDGLYVTWELVTAPLLATGIWQEADQNADRAVSEAEALAWATARLDKLYATLDGTTALVWRIEAVTWPTSFDVMQIGQQAITVYLAAIWPKPLTGEHRLTLANSFDPKHTGSWYRVAEDDAVAIYGEHTIPPAQYQVAFELLPASRQADGLDAPGAVEQPEVDAAAVQEPAPGAGALAQLSDLLRAPTLSPGFLALAVLIAMALGALHALTPGHGKTVVAAYLVGSRGTSLHAVSLGLVTTATHTGSVLLLGLATLLASRFIVPNDFFPWLELASGVLIILLGANLLYRRWHDLQHEQAGHGHHHDHDHEHAHPSDHGHDHDRAPQVDASGVTWRSLLLLGVSGGLAPCPDAIAILLLAVAIQRIPMGLALIVSFSVGLAIVLIAIGLAMLHSRRLFSRLDAFERVAPVLPLVSALVVLALGVGLTVRAL